MTAMVRAVIQIPLLSDCCFFVLFFHSSLVILTLTYPYFCNDPRSYPYPNLNLSLTLP